MLAATDGEGIGLVARSCVASREVASRLYVLIDLEHFFLHIVMS